MTNKQKTSIEQYVSSWAGYYMKLLQNKDVFLAQPDKLPDGFDRYGETAYKANIAKRTVQELLKFLQINNISDEDFLREVAEIRKAQIMSNWYESLSEFTEEDVRNSVDRKLNSVGEGALYEAGFSLEEVLEKVETHFKSRLVEEQIQNTLDEIKKLIGGCTDLANTYKLTFDLNICDTEFEYKQTNVGGCWYTSSRNC